jgi:sialic acid synthase SpsE
MPCRFSILVGKDIKAVEVFTEDNLIIRRPGAGMAPKCWDELIGKTAAIDLAYGDLITEPSLFFNLIYVHGALIDGKAEEQQKKAV